MGYGNMICPQDSNHRLESIAYVGDQCDWTTEGPYDGNERRKYRVFASQGFLLILIDLDAKGLLDFQERRGITSVVRWNLRLTIRCRL